MPFTLPWSLSPKLYTCITSVKTLQNHLDAPLLFKCFPIVTKSQWGGAVLWEISNDKQGITTTLALANR
jgi:hypothetical protein